MNDSRNGAGIADRSSLQGWIRWLLPWVMRHRKPAVASLMAAIVGMAATSLIPVIEKVVIDDVITARTRALAPFLFALGGIAVVRLIATVTRRLGGGAVAYGVQADLRDAVFDHLVTLDLDRHDQLPAGQVVSRANTDVNMVFGVLQMFAIITGNLVMLAMSLAIMTFLSPPLAAVAFVAVGSTFFVAWRLRRAVYVSTWDASQREAEMTAVAEEAISGVRVVKGFGQEDRELGRFATALEHLFGGRVRNVRIRATFATLLQTIPLLGQVAVLAAGGWLAIDGRLTVGTLVAFFTYLTQLAAPARMLAVFLAASQQARSGIERLRDLLETAPAISDDPAATELVPEGGSVAFESVDFAYRDGSQVLGDCTLRIAAGERVAVVGASGSGKTTLAMLLARFYDVDAGAVHIDGHDVRRVTLASLRSQVGIAFEEAFLFSGTVRENIAYGRPDATDDDVRDAARIAQADHFIEELADGYDSIVGEGGVTLSGGQRQRIALARVLLCDPALIVLDDATSAVDSRVEHAIHSALTGRLQGRTALLIAHRRSTLALADRIVLLDGGRIVADGTQADLEANSPRFRALLSGMDEPDDDSTHGIVRRRLPIAAEDTPITPQASVEAGLRRPGTTARAGSGGAGGSAGWIGPPSPALTASVEALPPIRDVSNVAVAAEVDDRGGLHFRRFIARWRRELLFGLSLVMLDALATLAVPMLVRAGIDHGVAAESLSVLGVISLVALATTTFDGWAMWLENLVMGRAAERVLVALRLRVFAHLQRLGLDFYDRELSGRLLSRLTSDVDTLSELLSSGLVNAAVSLATFVGMVVVLLLLDVRLALAVFAVTLPLIGATLLYQHLSRPAYDRQRDAIAAVLADLQENLSGIRVTQAMVRERTNRAKFHERDREFYAAGIGALRIQVGYFAFVELLSAVGIIVVLGYGTVLHQNAALTIGGLVAFLLYLTQFFSPIQQLSAVFDTWQSASAGMRKLDALLAERSTVPAPAKPRALPPGRGEVRFVGVRFAYPTQRTDAVGGLDLHIPSGQRVALVGETGSGKSTFVKLLARFYDPSSGRVIVDDVDLRELDPGAFRRRLGYVPQEPFLFAGTLRDNLTYGRPGASDHAVWQAVDAVGLDELVADLPGGLDHWLVERGRSLSTGQRQLICLARALVADPVLLLLDEATSNLDLASETRIERAMDVLSRGRTTVVIAHRLATAARADRILVMEAGRIVQDGCHEDLLAGDGPYRDLWRAYEGVARTT